MILDQGDRPAGLGIAIGIFTALAWTHLMASFLYGIEATDALTSLIVPLRLACVALFCLLPPCTPGHSRRSYDRVCPTNEERTIERWPVALSKKFGKRSEFIETVEG